MPRYYSNDELDKIIHEWHDGKSVVSLHEYLGVSEEDYGKWVQDSEHQLLKPLG